MTATAPRMTIKQVFRRPATQLKVSPQIQLLVPAKSTWATTCKHCSISYETHSFSQALHKARWHLVTMQPCEPLRQPLTLHECQETSDDEAQMPAL